MDNTANFHLLSSVQQIDRDSGDVQASSLSHALFVDEIIRDEINVDRLDLVTSRWYPDKRIAVFSAPGKTSQTPNRRLMWDFSNPDLPRFHISGRDEPYALGMRVDPTTGISKPIFGDGSGNVYRMDLPKVSKDGAGYTKQFDIAQTDFEYMDPSLKNLKKHFDYLEVFFRSHGPQTLDITPIIDGVPKTAVSIEMQGPGIGLSTVALGSTFKLAGGSGTFSRKTQLTGSGRAIALSCKNSGNAENLEISGINVLFRPGGSKPSGRN
jgi:hypothetical protein